MLSWVHACLIVGARKAHGEFVHVQNTALGAFLPQSVAAFAGEVPSSLLTTTKGLRAMAS